MILVVQLYFALSMILVVQLYFALSMILVLQLYFEYMYLYFIYIKMVINMGALKTLHTNFSP